MAYKNWKAKTVEKKEKEHISKYENNKILHTLTKKHSPQTVVFIEDEEDPWFVYCVYYQTKTGVINDDMMLIAKEVPDWVGYLIRLGYVEKK